MKANIDLRQWVIPAGFAFSNYTISVYFLCVGLYFDLPNKIKEKRE
jgi:hypothetical protein